MDLPHVKLPENEAQTRTLPLVQQDFFLDSTSNPADVMPEKKRSLKGLWITLVVIVGLLIVAYVGFAVFFMSHFAFNTTVNGINVAMQTAEEVDAKLTTDISSYTLQIEGRDQNATLSGSDIGLQYVADGQINTILANQNEWLWPLSLLPENEAEIQHVNVEFDEQKLATALAALPLMNKDQMVAPTNSSLGFEGGQYVIIPGEEGTTLDVERTTLLVQDTIDEGKTTLNLDEEGLYLRPEVAVDDQQLVADRDLFNQYVPFQIVYTLGDRREVLDGYTTINWVDTTSETPYLNTDSVWAWVAEFASRYDTLGSTRTFLNGYGEEKTVSGGTYGWAIDEESEYYAILTAYEQHLGEEREPILLGSAASLDAIDWGTSYLEVDLTEQHMWYFVDGVCVLETDVVTGNPNTGYETPEGVWSIFIIDTNVITRGDPLPDGGYSWGPTPVDYWMQFTSNGCGFHDANWQSNFGGNQYLITGSHGCINMPPAKAAELYGIVEMGTPVITHY